MRAVIVLGLVVLFSLAATVAAMPKEDTGDLEKLSRDGNRFAFDLYGRLSSKDGNLFFSPESISLAMAMVYDGARGDTSTEMARALHFPEDRDRLNRAYGKLLRHLNGEGRERSYQLKIANALWGQQGFSFLQSYVETTRQDYGAGLRVIDFAADAEKARGTINDWVAEQTADKIKDLLPQGTVRSDTRLVLTNAVYFKGTWERQFNPRMTVEAPFHVSANRSVRVPMMNRSGRLEYFADKQLQLLELPYKDGDLSMIVLLPRQSDGLADLEKSLSAAALERWLSSKRPNEVHVSLPRFRTTSEFQLNDQLAALGMPEAFTTRADLSGMDGKKDLMLSVVVHKAFVDVNEEGTEAAAATGVVIAPTAARITEEFRADHPFVFLIRDNKSGSILFLGRVQEPK